MAYGGTDTNIHAFFDSVHRRWSGSRSGYLTVVEPRDLIGYEIFEGPKQSACPCVDRNNNTPLVVMGPPSLDPSPLDCVNKHPETLRNLTKNTGHLTSQSLVDPGTCVIKKQYR